MNFESKNLKRAGIILTATLLMTPAWTAAQDTQAALANTARENLSGNVIHARSTELNSSETSQPWAISGLPSFTEGLGENLPYRSDAFSLVSKSEHQAGEYSEPLGQNVFGTDQAVDLTASVTDINCRHCGTATAGQTGQWVMDGCWMCDNCGCDVQGRPSFGFNQAYRLGWWGISSDGSPVKVGEFQDLASSPFWDVDGIWSNGSRTLDLTVSGLTAEANDAHAYYYGGPKLTVDFDYQRYLRHLDHAPLSGFDPATGTPGPTDKVVTEDLNVGEDYAIRVQQLDARFQGQLTNKLKWRIDLWGMRKAGERQANATAHCFNVNPPPANANYTCHVLSQRQSIDWTTMEIKPVVEAQVGKAHVEYSRPMRVFGQNDQIVDRTYTFDFSPVFGTEGPPFDYALVPENYTQTDRLKLNVPINEANQLYANLYVGDTENKFRDTKRSYYGYDLRLTNRAVDDVTVTAYTKLDAQNNELPTEFLTTPPFGVNAGPPDSFEPDSLRHPLEYNTVRAGLKGRWKSRSRNWLSIASGYEYNELSRDYADYDTLSGPFTQEDTQTHQINFGPTMRVSPNLDTFVRYKGRFINNPLIGVGESDGKFNTNLPEQVHGVEFGGTWSPRHNFMVTTLFGIENSWHDSQYANFDEDNYPILFTIWYAPTARLSLTTGYAYFSNWIDQDITIGFQDNPTETTRWNYEGYNNLFSFSANYAWTPCTQLVGGVEWDRGNNVFSVPPSTAGANWSALPTFSDVLVETTRINVGFDYEFRPLTTTYFRYVYFDFNDLSANVDSGTTNMFLAGFSMLR